MDINEDLLPEIVTRNDDILSSIVFILEIKGSVSLSISSLSFLSAHVDPPFA